jgi:arylsulfatase A-like enzyme
MLTGCLPTRVGFGGRGAGGLGGVLFPGWPIGLAPSEVTIARVLRDAGYATMAVGKWHCGDQPDFLPTNHGFDEWFGLPYSNDMGRQVEPPGGPSDAELEEAVRGLGVTLPWLRPPLPLVDGTTVVEQQPDQASLTGRYVDRALRFVRAHRDEPFFLYLAHLYVHLPIYVEDRFLAASRNGPYGGAVASIDWAAGVLLDELAALGLEERTLVVFTSDNGALDVRRGGSGSNLPLRGAKGTTWEGGQRVPFLVRWPGRVPAGAVLGDRFSSIDLLPTLARLCGGSVPGDRTIDGVDVGALWGLGGEAPDPERSFPYVSDGSIEAVRLGRWKLHVAKRGRPMRMLVDLASDVGETTDVSGDHPDVVARLEAELDRWRHDLGDELTGVEGAGVRPIGRVADARPLTTYDPTHPYVVAEYDLPDRG